MGALQKTFFRHVADASDENVKRALEELDYEVGSFIKPKISRGSQIKFKFLNNSLWIFETVWFEGSLEWGKPKEEMRNPMDDPYFNKNTVSRSS